MAKKRGSVRTRHFGPEKALLHLRLSAQNVPTTMKKNVMNDAQARAPNLCGTNSQDRKQPARNSVQHEA